MTERLPQIVAGVLETHAVRGRRVAVGLSGGVDSVVLLDVLDRLRKDWRLALSAVHVNHQISAHALEWEAFCKTLCQARGVALTVQRVRVPRDRSGVEAAARNLRFQTYGGLKTDFVALAHHLDDQVETFLLQLLRGAGPKGLAAMPVLRSGVDVVNPGASSLRPSASVLPPCILRPLLEVTRNDIEVYAKTRKLEWIEDDSNADSRYDRNFLRNELLPRLDARFPAYRETLSRASRNLADYSELAEDLAALDAR
ncbi:MAG TPA: tRNA lysidine(34) synthetase TilS, partial [Burkholderiales bacterium]|nr:tRNA lysidine(34) synthetase TilS [Burkholderiales bacterium]